MVKLSGNAEVSPLAAVAIILVVAIMAIGVFCWRVKARETPPPPTFGQQRKLPFPDISSGPVSPGSAGNADSQQAPASRP